MGITGGQLLLGLFPMNFILTFGLAFQFPYQISANCNFLFRWGRGNLFRFVHVICSFPLLFVIRGGGVPTGHTGN